MEKGRGYADLFRKIWRELELDLAQTGEAIDEIERAHNQVRRHWTVIKSIVDRDPLGLPESAQTELDARVTPRLSELAGKILVAKAIDEWYASVSPRFPASSSDAHKTAWLRLQTIGRLDSETGDGPVILKKSRWAMERDPGTLLADVAESLPYSLFEFLIALPGRIEASHPGDTTLAVSRDVTFRYSPSLDKVGPPGRSPLVEPVIGFAPILQAIDDVDVSIRWPGATPCYDVVARDMGDRASEAVRKLCEAGANIIVFPESTVHPDTIVAIKRAARRHGPRHKLKLIVAGTSRIKNGAALPSNESMLINEWGQEIGRQRKLHRWDIAPDDLVKIGVIESTAELNGFAGPTVEEYMEPGDTLSMFEHPELGRFAVLICEDISRSRPNSWLRTHVCLDWIFTPIFDTSMDPSPSGERWMIRSANGRPGERPCRVAIANSIPLTLKSVRGRASPQPECGVGACVNFGPTTRYRPYRANLDGGTAIHWTVIPWQPDDTSWKLLEPERDSR